MTPDELIAGARRELIHNIAVAPIVLLIRLPLGLIYVSLDAIVEGLEWINGWLPGWRLDYAQALRRDRQNQKQPTLLPERNRNHDQD